jgi:hypothetical protein
LVTVRLIQLPRGVSVFKMAGNKRVWVVDFHAREHVVHVILKTLTPRGS